MMTKDELIGLAKARAILAGVDPILCCAVCEQESSWNPWAFRDEPAFEERYVAKLHLGITESVGRAISWGLMQLIGETAREEGYTADLPMLCDPQTGLDRGLIHLRKELLRASGDVHNALQNWNGGSAPNYAAEVMARMPHYQGS